MKRILCLLLLSASLGASPGEAGWEQTEWGMSPEEVIAATGGKWLEDDGAEFLEPAVEQQIFVVVDDFKAPLEFQVHYRFDKTGLIDISVSPAGWGGFGGIGCGWYEDEMTGRLGQPRVSRVSENTGSGTCLEASPGTKGLYWTDATNDTSISMTYWYYGGYSLQVACFLSLYPLSGPP